MEQLNFKGLLVNLLELKQLNLVSWQSAILRFKKQTIPTRVKLTTKLANHSKKTASPNSRNQRMLKTSTTAWSGMARLPPSTALRPVEWLPENSSTPCRTSTSASQTPTTTLMWVSPLRPQSVLDCSMSILLRLVSKHTRIASERKWVSLEPRVSLSRATQTSPSPSLTKDASNIRLSER